MIGAAAKRLLDLVVVAAAAAVLALPMAAIAVAVRVQMGSPVLFRSTRPGHHGRLFVMYKFRTMAGEPFDQEGRRVPDDQRITRLGSWLRASSLDELPELINVIRGEMSLVGPRPLLPEYLDRYTPTQMRRHEVKPGITGWAQVNGRNALTWEEKFALDVWYVDHRSLWLDLRILAMTLRAVFARHGIAAPGHATMPEFMGSTGEEPD